MDYMELRAALDAAKPLYRLELELIGVPEAMNKSLRMHWTKRAKHNDYWYFYVANETRTRRPQAPLKKAKLTLTRFAPRTLDCDNCMASFKAIVDGLVKAGVLANDSWDVTGQWCLDQVKSKDKKILVIVEEMVASQ